MARNRTPRRATITLFLSVFILTAAVAASGCAEPLDFERQARERGTFGQEVYRIVSEDLERTEEQGPEKATALGEERDAFIDAVDTMLPPELLPELDAFLFRMLPHFDSGLMPGLTRKLAVLLNEAADDSPLLGALHRTFHRPEHMSDPQALQMMSHLMQYEGLQEVNQLLIDMVLENDGREGASSRLMIDLMDELVHTMRGLEASEDPERLTALLAEVLLSEDPAFAPPEGSADAQWVVRLDHRGAPLVTYNDFDEVPFPFEDGDGDGLADVNAEGHFVDGDGAVIGPLEPFGAASESVGGLTRDEAGRLRRSDGALAFEYVDLHATVLGHLTREARPMVEDDILFDLITATRPLLGERTGYIDERGDYMGYPRESDLLGLTSALLLALDQDDIPAVLEGAIAILDQHPDTLAGMLRAMERAVDTLDAYPSDTAPELNLFDELLPLLVEIVETPGLLEDLLVALDAPITARTGDAIAELMRFKAPFITVEKDGPYDACFADCERLLEIGTVERFDCIRACPREEVLQEAYDPATTPSLENRSLFEQTLAIIWESEGQAYNMHFTELQIGTFDLIEVADTIGDAMIIEDMAVAYLLSVTGDLALADVLSPALIELAEPLGADPEGTATDVMLWVTANILDLRMDAIPTPGQLTRLFNKVPLRVEDGDAIMALNEAVCKSGRTCYDAHADALFAAEASGMIDTLHPLAVAFNKHEKTALFARLVALIYHHYPSAETRDEFDGQPIAVTTNNLRSIEPALREILEDGALLASLGELGTIANGLELEDGSRFSEYLAPLLLHIIKPREGLTLHTGEASITDPAGNLIEPLSLIYVLFEALDDVVEAVEADAEADAAWTRAVDRLFDLLLELEDTPEGGARFAKTSSIALTKIALEVLRERWIDLETRGERSETLTETIPDGLADAIGGRMLPMAIDMFDWMDGHEGARAQLRGLLLHMLEADAAVSTQLSMGAYLMLVEVLDEVNMVAMMQGVASLIDPARRFEVEGFAELNLVQHLVEVLVASDSVDPDANLIKILQNATLIEGRDEMPVTSIGRAIRQVHRVTPGSTEAATPEDYAQLLRVVAAFLLDDARGGERLMGLIEFALHGNDEKN